MKISVIMWDGNFRKFTHTLDYFANQTFKEKDYEIIWVDYYSSSSRVEMKVKKYANARLVNLNHSNNEKWHMGVCINAGVKESKGDLLVIPDGDVAIEMDFLENAWKEHKDYPDLALYFRRYDETEESCSEDSRSDIEYMKKEFLLKNPTNFAGCLALKRKNFDRINGFETHRAFAGAGMLGMETYIRLRNAGMAVKWSSNKVVYHPWHPSTGVSNLDQNTRLALELARGRVAWINPYSGLRQSWLTRAGELDLKIEANESLCDEYLKKIPRVDLDYYLKVVGESESCREYYSQLLQKCNNENHQREERIRKMETKLVKKKQMLDQKNEEIARLLKELEEKPFRGTQSVASSKLEEVAVKMNEIEEAIIDDLPGQRKVIQDQSETIARLLKDVDEKDQVIKRRQERIDQMIQAAEERKQVLKRRQERIDLLAQEAEEKKQVLKRRQERIDQLTQEAEEKNQVLKRRQDWIDTLKLETEKKKEQLKRKQEKIDRLTAEVKELKKVVKGIENPKEKPKEKLKEKPKQKQPPQQEKEDSQ